MGAHVDIFTGQRQRIVRTMPGALDLYPISTGGTTHSVYPHGAEPPMGYQLPNPYDTILPGSLQLDGDLGFDRATVTKIVLNIEFHSPFYAQDVSQVQLVLNGNIYVPWTDVARFVLTPPWPTGFFPIGEMTVYVRGSYSHPGHPLPHAGLEVSFYYLDFFTP